VYEEYFLSVELNFDTRAEDATLFDDAIAICDAAVLTPLNCYYMGFFWVYSTQRDIFALNDFNSLSRRCLAVANPVNRRICVAAVSYIHFYLKYQGDVINLAKADMQKAAMAGFDALSNMFDSSIAGAQGVLGFCGTGSLGEAPSAELFQSCVYGLLYNIFFAPADETSLPYWSLMCKSITDAEEALGLSVNVADLCNFGVKQMVAPAMTLEEALAETSSVALLNSIDR